MKQEFTLYPPSPLERVQSWAHFGTWSVFGDWLPGMPSWSIEAREDGSIVATSEQVTIDLGSWSYDEETDLVTLSVSHDYPTRGLPDAD